MLRVGRFAARQQARIALHQLTALGVRRSTVDRWLVGGFLDRCRPGIYAVGSPAQTIESDLWEAVLYAGPGAMLSHATAAKWLDTIDRWPAVIHVSTPRRRGSLPGIWVHPRRTGVARTVYGAIPVTSIADTLLDLAAAGEITLVRRAFARLDYQRRLQTPSVRRACRRGRPGSVDLRRELDAYDPLTARTRSELEAAYLRLDLPRPDDVNVLIRSVSLRHRLPRRKARGDARRSRQPSFTRAGPPRPRRRLRAAPTRLARTPLRRGGDLRATRSRPRRGRR